MCRPGDPPYGTPEYRMLWLEQRHTEMRQRMQELNDRAQRTEKAERERDRLLWLLAEARWKNDLYQKDVIAAGKAWDAIAAKNHRLWGALAEMAVTSDIAVSAGWFKARAQRALRETIEESGDE